MRLVKSIFRTPRQTMVLVASLLLGTAVGEAALGNWALAEERAMLALTLWAGWALGKAHVQENWARSNAVIRAHALKALALARRALGTDA